MLIRIEIDGERVKEGVIVRGWDVVSAIIKRHITEFVGGVDSSGGPCAGTGAGGGNEVSGVEGGEGEFVENVGGSRPSETMRVGCGIGPPDHEPSESMRWTIALKTHPAKGEPSDNLWMRLYVS